MNVIRVTPVHADDKDRRRAAHIEAHGLQRIVTNRKLALITAEMSRLAPEPAWTVLPLLGEAVLTGTTWLPAFPPCAFPDIGRVSIHAASEDQRAHIAELLQEIGVTFEETDNGVTVAVYVGTSPESGIP
ncbi:MAG: hypothetical protein AAGA32_03070 [Pseudomonadota bacterium]